MFRVFSVRSREVALREVASTWQTWKNVCACECVRLKYLGTEIEGKSCGRGALSIQLPFQYTTLCIYTTMCLLCIHVQSFFFGLFFSARPCLLALKVTSRLSFKQRVGRMSSTTHMLRETLRFLGKHSLISHLVREMRRLERCFGILCACISLSLSVSRDALASCLIPFSILPHIPFQLSTTLLDKPPFEALQPTQSASNTKLIRAYIFTTGISIVQLL